MLKRALKEYMEFIAKGSFLILWYFKFQNSRPISEAVKS